MKRREFMHKSCIGIAGAASLGRTSVPSPSPITGMTASLDSEMQFRTLGKTGLKVSVFGFGAMITPDAQLLYRAIREYGVNYIDTAHGYQGGTNESNIVAKGVGDKRKDVIITTKFGSRGDKSKIIEMVEVSLGRLNTDYIDIILLHGGRGRDDIMTPDVLEAITQLKKDGKVRFCGTSTHRNEAETVRAVAESDFYDVVVPRYNFKSDQDMTDAVAEAAKKGIGVVAMKVMAKYEDSPYTQKLNPFQSALRWVVDNKNVATTIPSIKSTQELEENYGAVMSAFSWSDRKILHRYSELLDGEYCRNCGECGATCPRGVEIGEVNRALMYAEGYGDPGLAGFAYGEIPASENVSRCGACPECTAACPYGVRIADKMERAAAYFG